MREGYVTDRAIAMRTALIYPLLPRDYLRPGQRPDRLAYGEAV
jgi:hypothetical protein